MKLHPVIMAGGSGTRLWPISREYHPKPFMSVSDGGSLLQDTVARLDGVPNAQPPVIVCNEEHRFLAAEHTRRIDRPPKSILLEPEGRNTAPTLTLAALALQADAQDGEDPLMLALPADHAILDADKFRAAVESAARLGEAGFIVAFGVPPDAPSAAYGYVRKGAPLAEAVDLGAGEAYELARFVEKPDAETARRMLDTGEYLWNSGMFVMRASAWMEELERFRPDIAESCRQAHAKGAWDGMFYRPDADTFLACPPDAIDYAVMERIGAADGGGRHHRAAIAPLDARWSDIGSWAAIMDAVGRDADGNVVRGDVYTHRMRNSMVFGLHRLVAAVGLEDVIVVETPGRGSGGEPRERGGSPRDSGAAEGGRQTGARKPQARPPPMGMVRRDRRRPPLSGQANHGQPGPGAVAPDAPPPLGALGGSKRRGAGDQRQRSLYAARKPVHIRPRGRNAPSGKPGRRPAGDNRSAVGAAIWEKTT